jgi:hypothetical protein
MKTHLKIILALAIAGALAATVGLWWYVNMERAWGPVHARPEAMQKNRVYVATLLLRQRGHTVTVASTLGETEIARLPDGTLLMADSFGTLAPAKAEQLLAWVRRGNTLVAQPRHISDAESDLIDDASAADDEDEEEEAADEEAAAPAVAPPAASAEPTPSPDTGSGAEEEDALPKGSGGGPLAAMLESDPIAVRFGVRQSYLAPSAACLAKRKQRAPRVKGQASSSCPAPIPECEAQEITHLTLPGTGHLLELETGRAALVNMPDAPAPLWTDVESSSVQVYAEGKGRVVMLATNYFDNGDLQHKDHAELLAGLASLSGATSHVMIIKYLDVQPWYQLLWGRFHMLMIAFAALLALAMWAAVRRFGPLLPEPALERRSLMEHIDASGAWLWKADGGRAVLLEAARAETLALVRRRAPGLVRLAESELTAALAALCNLPQAHVRQALYDEAASHPQQFTRQIRTLQTLRNHHER